jgi:hypothetical protein
MMVSRDVSSPVRSSAGLTGYRYLLALLVLVVLAAGPMALAITAGLTTLGSPPPASEPFLQPSLQPADHELRVMVDDAQRPEPHDRAGVEYR